MANRGGGVIARTAAALAVGVTVAGCGRIARGPEGAQNVARMDGLRERFIEAGKAGGGKQFTASGYYVFLGKGDYAEGHPVSLWTFAQWEGWMDRLKRNGHDRLWFLMNGHTLAYPSKAYPEIIDAQARTAHEPGLVAKLVEAAKLRGIKPYAVFTTDGHGTGFGSLHHEIVSEIKSGAPDDSWDALCLEEPAVQKYIQTIFEEVLATGARFEGVVFHPTESNPERFNKVTREKYLKETGKDIMKADPTELRAWFNEVYAKQAAEWYRWWMKKIPGLDPVLFNCHWMNGHEEVYRKHLPPEIRVCVWDYDYKLADWRKRTLPGWVKAFGPGRVLFMPSSGGYPEFGRPPGEEPLRGYDRELSLAAHFGLKEAVFFAGWGTGGEEEEKIDLGLLSASVGCRKTPDDAMLDELDAHYDDVRSKSW